MPQIDQTPALLEFKQVKGITWLYNFQLIDESSGLAINLSDYNIVCVIENGGTILETLYKGAGGITLSGDNLGFTVRKDWVSFSNVGVATPALETLAKGVFNLRIFLSESNGVDISPIFIKIEVVDQATELFSVDANLLIHKIIISNGFAIAVNTFDVVSELNAFITNFEQYKLFVSSFLSQYSNSPFEFTDPNGNISNRILASGFLESIGIITRTISSPEITKLLNFLADYTKLIQGYSTHPLEIVDEAGNISNRVLSNGFLESIGIIAKTISSPEITKLLAFLDNIYSVVKSSSNFPLEVTDINGNISNRILSNGFLESVGIIAKTISSPEMTKLFSMIDVLNSVIGAFSINGLEVTDINGNKAVNLTNTGTLQVLDLFAKGFLQATSVQVGKTKFLAEQSENNDLLSIEDVNGNRLAYIDQKAKGYGFDFSECFPKNIFGFLADINHDIIVGQSLSAGAYGTPIISSNQKYNSLMFNGGVHVPFDNMANFTSFVPLVEAIFPTNSTQGETVASGISEMFFESLINDGYVVNDNYKHLFTVTGESGKSIAELGKAQAAINGYYTRNITAIQKAYDIAIAQGKSYNVSSFIFIHGEQDILTANQEYYINALVQLRKDLIADAKAITKQKNDPLFLITQVASQRSYATPNVSVAQLRASTTKQKIVLAETSYQTDYYTGDYVHKVAASYKKMGAAIGHVLKKMLIDGNDWLPLYVKNYTVQGNIIELEYNIPKGNLVLDTTLVTNPGNYGFNLFNNFGAEVTITSVQITRPNTIKIVASTPILRYFKLYYANPNGIMQAGPTSGMRGNVRDQSGDTVIFHGSNLADPTGFVYPVHRWAAIQEIIFQNL